MLKLTEVYRPTTLDDMIGETNIIYADILRYQIEEDEYSNCYLFAGPSGSGKTTLARAFARKLNGNMVGCQEHDCASNGGVNDIAQIITQVQHVMFGIKSNVLILDECHQLSRQAWDYLLKSLEDGVGNCVIILCTTRFDKVPETILSRAMLFKFKRFSDDEITDYLLSIFEKECLHKEASNIFLNDAHVEEIAKAAKGNFRTAISNLQMCLVPFASLDSFNSFFFTNIAIDTTIFVEIIKAKYNGDAKTLDVYFDKLYNAGYSDNDILNEMLICLIDEKKSRILGHTTPHLDLFDSNIQEEADKILELKKLGCFNGNTNLLKSYYISNCIWEGHEIT